MPFSHAEHILERLNRAVKVSTRRMFGGVGIYQGEQFFALIPHDALYLRVDDENRPDFEARGMEPFQSFADKPSMKAYYALPFAVLDNTIELRKWVEKSLRAAQRAATGAPRAKRRTKSAPAKPAPAKSEKLLNIGPVSRRWLREIGVRTRADLQKLGSVAAFKAVEKRGHAPNVLLLYALEGALLGLRWNLLPDVVKLELRARAGRD